MFEDENLNDMYIELDVVPSPLMVMSPPASPFQKEEFGECVSQPSVKVFGAVLGLLL